MNHTQPNRYTADYWLRADYLAHGNSRQQAVWQMLQTESVLETLAAYSPVIAGTIPLGVDTAESDVDVLCALPGNDVRTLRRAASVLRKAFAGKPQFALWQTHKQGLPCVVCRFLLSSETNEVQPLAVETMGRKSKASESRSNNEMRTTGTTEIIEVFMQYMPVEKQQAFRHLVAEARLLEYCAEHRQARAALRAMKERGINTEPAFAAYFRLADHGFDADPYQALLQVYELPERLVQTLANGVFA